MKRSWLTKSVGILAAMGLIAALCGVPVSAAPMVIQQTQAQASFVATAPTVTTQNATGTVVNANGQTAGYFHGTLTAKGTNDTSGYSSVVRIWHNYFLRFYYSQSHNE